MSQDTSNHSFDELARGLAEGSISRRRALKLFAGTALAALIPSTRAMAAITCPPGTVKICHVPQRADGTCRRGAAQTRCLSPEAAAVHAGHPCDCCGGCGGTDDCRKPKPRTCFSTSTTTSTTSTSTTPGCLPTGSECSVGTQCCGRVCFANACCSDLGAGCSSDDDCCTGFCSGGTCNN